jgi:hypothetical protein
MGWVLTASGSLASPHEFAGPPPVKLVQPEQRQFERLEIVDASSGADLRLRGRKAGGLQATLVWTDLDVVKVVQANGDFHARLAARQDVLVIVRTGSRLRVTRNGQTGVVSMDRADEDGLDLVQAVLAGSHAARAFRAVHRQLTDDARASAPGVALDSLDALLALLQGEPAALDRRAPDARNAAWRVSRIVRRTEPTCYSAYEAEVISAWDDYSQCIYDVRWFPGMQEVCAFTWLLRVESAWFRFIACSSFPLKVQ